MGTTPFTVRSIAQHYGNRAKITVVRDERTAANESIDISLTLEEAAALCVGSTYTFDFAEIVPETETA